MHYRPATAADVDRLAALHARSWQETYRGILPDSFLDHEVEAERLAYWQTQFQKKTTNRHLLLAEENGQLAGFACAYTDDDLVYGALLDNLHVAQAYKGRGIGRQLMQQIAGWVVQNQATPSLYLWVYEKNHPARQFYERLGAINQQAVAGEHAVALRYVWADARTLAATA